VSAFFRAVQFETVWPSAELQRRSLTQKKTAVKGRLQASTPLGETQPEQTAISLCSRPSVQPFQS